jgi:hypothetical protein
MPSDYVFGGWCSLFKNCIDRKTILKPQIPFRPISIVGTGIC